MSDERTPRALLDEIASLAHADELARLVKQVGDRAVAARKREVPEVAAPLVRSSPVPRAEARTSHGDAIAALERGPSDRAERRLLGALLARGVSLSPPSGVEAEDKLAGELLWLSAHTPLDALPFLDAALADRSSGLWGALCDLVRRIDAGREPTFDRADALTGAAALAQADAADVRAAASKLSREVEDPLLARALSGAGGGDDEGAQTLEGELEPAPRSAVAQALLTLTGLAAIARGVRLLGRVALGRKHPARVVVTADGVRVHARTEMLGKVTGEAEYVVPTSGLSRAVREVRFARLGLYAGLLALAIGSYLGVSLFVDGARAASPSLIGQGLLFVALGVGIELAMSTLLPARLGHCRVVLVPRTGASICVGRLDTTQAHRMLSRLAQRR